MGTYSNLYVDGKLIASEKEEINNDLVSLFDLTDYRSLKISEGEKLPFSIAGKCWEDEESITLHYFETFGKIIIDRLKILGYTIEFMKKFFNSEIQNIREQFKGNHKYYKSEERLKFIEDLNFEKFINYIQNGQLDNYLADYELVQLCGGDIRGVLYLYLVRKEAKVISYDLTHIAHGYYEDLIEQNDNGSKLYDFFTENYITPFRYRLVEKTIILTEGPTDCEYLSRMMKLLYPHLERYYSFLDYSLFKIPSGAGNLANSVKAFIGIGLTNRVIAIFDNDVAGQSAISSLKINLPNNFRVLKYPSLKLLENYPAIGPLGENYVDVNGYAGSIELYMGANVLKKDNGQLEPVRWGGYDAKTGKYQASIIAKGQVQKRFKQILKLCENNREQINKYDFSGMDLILNRIFNAFNE